jgi:hypothetical protein
MRIRKIAVVTAALAAFGTTSAASLAAQPAAKPAPVQQAATRQFEGTVVSVNRSARTFRLRDVERGTVTIRVTSRTRFERVTFAGLRRGQTNIEAIVRRSNGAWVATSVERSGGGGRHGGSDD